ncbi:patatin-like phospholipase family protein [Nocardia araoensis]|uniref:patatin-like phospholipase family protein n=1 Tax=Nocardia araoensis TaxID=228600 RepID=UPI0012F65C5D|nr:patatin-like phospholipase family protein [Nocardia araoensis]
MTQERPVVRILAGVAGRSLTLMVGMAIGAMDALAVRRDQISGRPGPTMQPTVVGVSGGAIAAAAIALGMTRGEARQIAIEHPEQDVLGARSFRALLTRRALYPEARIRELAHAIVGDRTFADFALDPKPSGQLHEAASSLLIPVYSAEHGTLLLPRDLPKLGLSDLPVADVLVAATRIPGALPAATGLEDIFDGGCQYRVPHDIFSPHPALILDLYGPQPYDSRGGLIFPILHPSLPAIRSRPRPFHDPALRETTIFAHQPYGAALKPPARSSEELFDTGYDIATSWIHSRTHEQLRTIVDPQVLGFPDKGAAANPIQSIA